MCVHTRDPIIYSEFHRNPFRGFGAPGAEIWPFPLLWLVAFTTACTTVQAVTTDQSSSYSIHYDGAHDLQIHYRTTIHICRLQLRPFLQPKS